MKDNEFNSLVDRFSAEPIPNPPSNLEQNVLRRIRRSKTQRSGLREGLSSWLFRPSFLAATLAIVVTSSFLTASFLARSNFQENSMAALGFDVFSQPITLPTDY